MFWINKTSTHTKMHARFKQNLIYIIWEIEWAINCRFNPCFLLSTNEMNIEINDSTIFGKFACDIYTTLQFKKDIFIEFQVAMTYCIRYLKTDK